MGFVLNLFAPALLLFIVYHVFTLAIAVPVAVLVAVVRYLLSTRVHYCTNLTLVAPFELRESYLLNSWEVKSIPEFHLCTKPILPDLYALGQAS
jgi:hypothetical protein